MSAPTHKWTFQVRGRLSKGAGSPVITNFDVIVESGERDENSPHCLHSIRGNPQQRGDEYFEHTYSTIGADREVEAPERLSVFLRTERGRWKPYVVSIHPHQATRQSPTEMSIELGTVSIDPDDTLYTDEAPDVAHKPEHRS
jgi:hypothetical protein